MKRLLKSVLTISFLVASVSLWAQPVKSFSGNSVSFIKELETYIEAADKKTSKELSEKLKPVWETILSEPQKQQIITTANAMLKKRMNAIPNFRDYFYCILAFQEGGKSDQQFTDWHATLTKAIPKLSSGKYDQYLNFSEDLFRNNALYKSDAISWFVGTSDFVFSFDSIPKITIPLTDLRGITRADSTYIFGTSGVLAPTEFKFYGKKGRLLWSRVGLKEEEANAQLNNYILISKIL
jgi:hypothetical protein